jgi:tryptophan 7-halogenase
VERLQAVRPAVAERLRDLVILGGGSAGWLVASLLAAEWGERGRRTVRVTLVESPDSPAIGVGEGTWPSMRATLHRIGLDEAELLRECDAAFKQGSCFRGWVDGQPADRYYHPFTLPVGHDEADLAGAWLHDRADRAFADCVGVQPALCEAGLGPKQVGTPPYGAVVNYGYHFDAVKLGLLLRRHATQVLGVRHCADEVRSVRSHDTGDIAALVTAGHGELSCELFIDCSGMASVLLGGHYGVPLRSARDVLFNDSALAVQVAHATSDAPLACATVATAHAEGWTWDIALPARRGVGLVYSSAHTDDEAAERALRAYLDRSAAGDMLAAPRRIRFEPGHRATFWHRNCVAVGLAAGFIEPLEASALALVELSAAMIRDELPATRAEMDIVARRFNESFDYRWARIIDFLKLHYVLSRRDDSDYWHAHRQAATLPDSLAEWLQLWQHRAPSRNDLFRHDEVFPVASYQYVLYGMGFVPQRPHPVAADNLAQARSRMQEAERLTKRLLGGLPRHRELIDHIRMHGMPVR